MQRSPADPRLTDEAQRPAGTSHDSATRFVTPRLRCRRWQPGDLERVRAVYADPEVVRYVGDGRPLTAEDAQRWMQVTAHNYAIRGYGMFALDALSTGKTIGFCGLVHPGGQAEAEVKYAFDKGCWGQGFATEAVSHLLAYGHSAHGLDRVIATVAPANAASQHVLRKAGARLLHTRRNPDGGATLVFEWRPEGQH